MKPIKDNLHLNCLSMNPARFKYKSSLSTNLFPVIKPKLAQMQSNSTDFTISNLAKFGDWQQNLKLPSSQIASLLSVTPVVTSPISTDKNPDEDDQYNLIHDYLVVCSKLSSFDTGPSSKLSQKSQHEDENGFAEDDIPVEQYCETGVNSQQSEQSKNDDAQQFNKHAKCDALVILTVIISAILIKLIIDYLF